MDDAPLDFSVKSRTPTPSAVKSSAADIDDVPMDLSVKKKEDSPIKPSVKVCYQRDYFFTFTSKTSNCEQVYKNLIPRHCQF